MERHLTGHDGDIQKLYELLQEMQPTHDKEKIGFTPNPTDKK
jgi:hypothetical protein